MCYDCGCGMPDENHGDPKHITKQTIKELAEVNKTSEEEIKKRLAESLQK